MIGATGFNTEGEEAMEFVIERGVFFEKIQKIQTVVERRSAIPILQNVLIEATAEGKIIFTATDLEVVIIDSTSTQVEEPGCTTLSAKMLFEILRELPPEPVRIKTMDNDWAEITCGASLFKMVGLPADTYPRIPEVSQIELHPLPSDILEKLIAATSFAASREEDRALLSGVYFTSMKNSLNMVATDGHRLALLEHPVAGEAELPEFRLILSAKALKEFKRMFQSGDQPTLFGTAELTAVCRKNSETIIAKLMEGDYPEYQQVIPEESPNQIEFDRSSFLNVLRRVSLVADQKTNSIKIRFTPNQIILTAASPQFGNARDELPVEYSGTDVEIAYNATYLKEAIQSIEDVGFRFQFEDSSKATMISPAGEKPYRQLCLVMPMVS